MRHGKKINHLGRTASHRKALLSNLATSLILHKRIETTLAKAKALRKYVEPLLTKSKSDTTHARRTVFAYLQNKEAIKVLFDEISEKIASRNGGYTRIIKLGNRLGDNAEMCLIELVDYNELLLADRAEKAGKTKRSRRGKGKSGSTAAPVAAAAAPDADSVAEDTPTAELVEESANKVESSSDGVVSEVVAAPIDDATSVGASADQASDAKNEESSEEEKPKD
jgi:large subunit ribosomal protein L17